MDIPCLKAPAWESAPRLLHGFLGRQGGRSEGAYGSLNLSFEVGDDPQRVKDNLCDAKKAVGIHDLRVVTMRQVHGERIVEVRDKTLKEAGEADGMVTETPGLFLGVLTADCVPILFLVPDKKVVAVAHAGWRGTLAGIAAKMVGYLRTRHGAEPVSVEAALGPAIGSCCYRVGSEVAASMTRKWGDLAESAIQTKTEGTLLDLRALNASLLEDAGVARSRIFRVGPCTSCASEGFFSYRREQGETGRQLSFIGWLD